MNIFSKVQGQDQFFVYKIWVKNLRKKLVKPSEETCEKNTQNLNVHISISVFVTK